MNCAHCGTPFSPNKAWQKYCSSFCNKAAYYARKQPPSPLDDPQVGPTATQEAEFERRKTLSQPEDTQREAERLEHAKKLARLVEAPTLADLMKGDKL